VLFHQYTINDPNDLTQDWITATPLWASPP
jgi:hypothetical protein